MLLLYTGLRADEMLSLRIEDTPAGHGKPSINVKRGKGCVGRVIDIPEWFCDVIRDFIVTNRKGAKPGSALVASEKGFRTLWIDSVEVSNGCRLRHKRQERSARMIYHCLLKRIKRIGIAAGIGRLTPHMLRHTFATILYAQGCDVFYVQDQLGHSDPKVTQIYARTFSESRKKQTNSLPVW
jgi:integrase